MLECKADNIDVTAWVPSTISTRLTNYKKDFMTIKTDSFARQALSRSYSGISTGNFLHDIMLYFIQVPMSFTSIKYHPMGMF